jgi:tRNA(Ile)-lysidine synthase TilS/MesJ
MKLNPLAVHYDNGWGTKISTENIKNSCDKLKVDLITVVEDWNTFKNDSKSFFILFSSRYRCAY